MTPVIGGATSLVGGAAGVCGLAQVSCDGAKRNHVSLTFAESCPDKVAIIAAQESAHNWGLEHVTDPTDVMYPYAVADAPAYVDRCVEVSNQTGSPLTQCTSSHALYCPEGQGEAQNGHAELLGVFGPRTQDLEAPVIVETTPRNGDTWTTDDVFVVTATVADDSDFVGVRWSWTEGLPAELGASLTRCTNQVCDLEYPAWKPIDTPYDFVELNHPPAGSYRITLEVIDARGHWVGKEIAFTVVEGDGAPSNTGMPGDDGGDLETGPGWTTDEGVAFADDAADEDDCACQARGRGDPLWLALLLALGPRSRRRRGSSRGML